MKICIISNLYKPYNRGGAEQVVKDTVEGLVNRGEDVVLITTMPFSGLSSLLLKKDKEAELLTGSSASNRGNLKIYRFYPLNLFFYANDYKHNVLVRLIWHFLDIFNIHSYFVVKNILKKEKPDVVHTHNLKGIGYLIPKAIKSLKIKHIHTVHDIQLYSPSGLMLKDKENNWEQVGFLTQLYSLICNKLFQYIDTVISPSEWLMDYYIKKGFFKKAKQVVLKNPTTVSIAGVLDNNSSINSKISFISIGQVEEHKGILFLIDVFNSLKDMNMKLEIIGDGSVFDSAKKMIKNDNIIFLGRLSHKEAMEKLRMANFFILPSLCYENFPTVILESLGLGTPVLVADIGGAGELVDIDSGYKFEAGNKDDLIRVVKLAVENSNNFDSGKIKDKLKGFEIGNYINELLQYYKKF